jgi:hypothetical protein
LERSIKKNRRKSFEGIIIIFTNNFAVEKDEEFCFGANELNNAGGGHVCNVNIC